MLTPNTELNERMSMMPKRRMKLKDLKPSTSVVVDKDNNILFISNDKEEAREWMASYLKTSRIGSSTTVKRIDYEKFSDEDTKKKIERWFKMNEETNMTFSSTSPLYGKEDLVLAANSILEATNKNRENILAFLYVNGNTDVSVLAGTLDMDERQVESMVKQLERDRLVVSTSGEVSLTKDGKKAAQKANPTLKSVKAESAELDEMTKTDKKTIDAFYNKKEDDKSFVVNSTGTVLKKVGFAGAQDIAKWENGKVKIVGTLDDRQSQEIVNYIKKTFPKNMIVESVELDEASTTYFVMNPKKPNSKDRMFDKEKDAIKWAKQVNGKAYYFNPGSRDKTVIADYYRKGESVELDEADAESDAIALTYMVGNETSEDITKPDLKRMAESNRRFGSFEPALKMAIQKGWLQEKGGWVSITDKGRKLNSMMDS